MNSKTKTLDTNEWMVSLILPNTFLHHYSKLFNSSTFLFRSNLRLTIECVRTFNGFGGEIISVWVAICDSSASRCVKLFDFSCLKRKEQYYHKIRKWKHSVISLNSMSSLLTVSFFLSTRIHITLARICNRSRVFRAKILVHLIEIGADENLEEFQFHWLNVMHTSIIKSRTCKHHLKKDQRFRIYFFSETKCKDYPTSKANAK